MDISTSKIILTVVLILWLFTPLRSITIMIGGKNIFIKASKGDKSCYYPIVNLFSMLEIAGISTYFGILFFVPVLNMVVLTLMSYKLGQVFKVGFFYKIGLIILPIVFYPLLGSGKRIYKLKDDNYFKALDNARAESINLMTEEEIKEENNVPYEESNVDVDSIFKSDIELMEQAAPYKAAKIDLYGMEKLKNKEAEKKSVEDMLKTQEQIEKEKEKKEEVETLDL